MEATGSLEAPLVGRHGEMERVAAVLRRVVESGQPMGVLVSGEAGAGKSRFLRETVGSLKSGEWRVLDGYALPGQGVPPYFAINRALRRLDRLMPGDGSAAAGDHDQVEASAGQLRFLEAVAARIESSAEVQPTLVVLDDMQWAGAGDWAAVAHTLRSARGPIAFLISAREEGLWDSASTALKSLLELNRQRLLADVRLGQLSTHSVRELCMARLDSDVSDAVLEAVFARTDGNPFLVEELLSQYVRSGVVRTSGGVAGFSEQGQARDEVPASVHMGTLQTLESLGSAARDVVEIAAIAGRQFTAELLTACGLAEDGVAGGLRAAAGVGLVQGDAGGTWTFRHDLIREAVIAGIDAGRRGELHRRVAEALTQEREDETRADDFARIAALAYHWREAREEELAARAALEASEAAERSYAPDEALELARVAYQAALRIPAGSGSGRALLIGETLLRLGDAQVGGGQYVEAEGTFRRVLDLSLTDDNRERAGQTWLRLGQVARRREEAGRAAEAFSKAIGILEAIPGQGAHVARALVELASIAGLTLAEYGSAEEYAGRALALARTVNAPRIEAEALIAIANSRSRSEGPHAARPMLAEALTRAEAANQVSLASETAAGLSNNYYWSGELRRAEYFARKRLELATRAHDIFGLRHGHSWLALVVSSKGEWAEAQGLLADAEPMLARLASPEPVGFIRVISAFIHYRLGEHDLACARIGEAMELLEPLGDGTLLWYGSLAALIYLAGNRQADAEFEIARQEQRLAHVPPTALPARSARAALVMAYVQKADLSAARECAKLLSGFEEDFHWSPVRLSLGLVEAASGNIEAALEHLREAETKARQEGQRPDLGLILLARAELMPVSAERTEALSEAVRVLEGLGMRRELGRALRLLPVERVAALPHHLTAREAEVARLVGQGLTNREIAARLVISERTVVNHVANIFAKVGVENRAGLAAFVVRSGL